MSKHEHGDWCEVGDEYKGYRIECGHCDMTVDEVVGSFRADLARVTAERDALVSEVEQLRDNVDRKRSEIARLHLNRDHERGLFVALTAERTALRAACARGVDDNTNGPALLRQAAAFCEHYGYMAAGVSLRNKAEAEEAALSGQPVADADAERAALRAAGEHGLAWIERQIHEPDCQISDTDACSCRLRQIKAEMRAALAARRDA
jgi:hypothetical protein